MRQTHRSRATRFGSLASVTLMALLAGCVAPGMSTAGGPSEDGIRVPPLHVGDALAFSLFEHETADGEEVYRDEGTSTLFVEGASRAFDAFGIERETVAIRGDWSFPDDDTSYTCHALAGGVESVRWDAHDGYSWRERRSLAGLAEIPGARVFEGETFYGGSCDLMLDVPGRTLRPGDRLGPEVLERIGYWGPVGAGSDPAVATEHEGRPALAFTWRWQFQEERAQIDVVFVEGVPSFASLTWHAEGDGWTWGGEWRLTGFTPGDGSALADAGVRLPARHPHGAFEPWDMRRLDDSGFALRYSFAEALDVLRRDPTTDLGGWLARRPDAVLTWAGYWSTPWGLESDRATDGVWIIRFVTPGEHGTFATERVSTDALGTPLPDALKPTHNALNAGPRPASMPYPASAPTEIATAEHVARMAEDLVPRDDVRRISYRVHVGPDQQARPLLSLDNANATFGKDGHGKMVYLDLETGGLLHAWNATRTGRIGILAAPADVHPRDDAGGVAPPVGIGWREAVAAPALLAILALFGKLALTLYTRLARDSLLENPVRARLYERIRAEPGIHREDLIDFAGIGNGATRHHLRKLVAHGFVLEMAHGGFARYYAAGEVTPEAARQHALLRVGRAREVYELYAAEPRVPLREAARRLGMSAPGVHRVRQRLAAAGLLRR